MDRVPNPYIHPSAWRNCLENSRKRLSAPLWWQEAPELGLLPPLLAALGAPIRDLSRISKQFRKGSSRKFLCSVLRRPETLATMPDIRGGFFAGDTMLRGAHRRSVL